MNMKRCVKCGQVKADDAFYWHDAKHERRMSRCKPCVVNERMARKGMVRRSPYGAKPQRKHGERLERQCEQCEIVLSYKAKGSTCALCLIDKLDKEYGVRDWRLRLRREVRIAAHRVRAAMISGWNRKMDTLVRCIEIRQRPHGECERKRSNSRRVLSWSERLSRLSSTAPRDSRSDWERVMDSKARNWRRKARKVTVYVQGDITRFNAIIGATGIQMRFNWAETDT